MTQKNQSQDPDFLQTHRSTRSRQSSVRKRLGKKKESDSSDDDKECVRCTQEKIKRRQARRAAKGDAEAARKKADQAKAEAEDAVLEAVNEQV